MILHVSSNASYNSVSNGRSRAIGVHYLSNTPPSPNQYFKTYNTKMNGLIYVPCKIMKNVVASAAEAEFGTIFLNGQEAVPIRTTLEEIKWSQPPTPVLVENYTATGIANRKIKQKMSKEFEMGFYWICDRIAQKQFNVYWKKGDLQKGYYHSKHHPPSNKRTVIPTYLHVSQIQHSRHLQGYVNSALGALDMHTINTGAQGAQRQITQYSCCVYSCCKMKTTGHPIFHKYSRYDNGDLCKIPEQNEFNKNSLS